MLRMGAYGMKNQKYRDNTKLQQLCQRLKDAFAPWGGQVELIGSVAVPALDNGGAPDFLLGMPKDMAEQEVAQLLQKAGYAQLYHDPSGYVLTAPLTGEKADDFHMLWLAPLDGILWQNALWLRNCLQKNRDLRQEYCNACRGEENSRTKKENFFYKLVALREAVVRPIEADEVEKASTLCLQVFLEYEAGDYDQEGIETFRRKIAPDVLYNQWANGTMQLWGCFAQDHLLGVAALRSGNHLAMVYVDRRCQHMGMGVRLAQTAMQACGQGVVTAHASLKGIPFYECLGFEATGHMRTENGITFLPMEKRI